ncbi:MAG TPA: glycosyltransferase [Bacteroidia bacterium]|nr:glycosyltransferase [Bacteroidia bacterium]
MQGFDFSVLMPVYIGNTGEEVGNALKSMLNQTLHAKEIVIVRDGPVNDEVAAILSDISIYPEVKLISLEKHRGIGAALSEGIKNCSFEWIARMDADDIAYATRFEETVNYLQSNPGLSLVGTYYAEKSDKGKNFVRKVPADFSKIIAFSKFRNPHSHPTVFYKKADIQDAGGYKNFYFAEDWHLWLRMFKKGYKSANIPKVLVYTQGQNYNRRLGVGALLNDIKAISVFLKEGLIGFHHFIANVVVRIVVRLMPFRLARIIYQNYLRSVTKD